MTNELKALKEIELAVNYCNQEVGIFDEKDDRIKIIEHALTRIENLIIKYGFNNIDELETALKDYEELKIVAKPLTDEEKKSINSVAKRLKALEIITKSFDLGVELGSLPDGTPTYKLNVWCKGTPTVVKPIPKEEFDLLKEVLK